MLRIPKTGLKNIRTNSSSRISEKHTLSINEKLHSFLVEEYTEITSQKAPSRKRKKL